MKIAIHSRQNKNPSTKPATITESYHPGRPITPMNSKLLQEEPYILHSKNPNFTHLQHLGKQKPIHLSQ
jgi:hypothetical protein